MDTAVDLNADLPETSPGAVPAPVADKPTPWRKRRARRRASLRAKGVRLARISLRRVWMHQTGAE